MTPRAISDRGVPLESTRPGAPRARLLRLGESRAPVPDTCACCGGLAPSVVSIGDGEGRHLLVGYCDECAAHVSTSNTRRWSALAAAALFGGTLAAGLPVALPWSPLASNVLFAVVGALCVPLAARAFDRPKRGHAAAGPAVFFSGAGELVCRRAEWAEDFARRLGVTSEPSSARSRWFVAVLAVAAAAALAAGLLHGFHHPLLRALNLGEATFELFVDGHAVGRVQPSSTESPSAGFELRVPAGRRVLEARDLDGQLVDRVSVRVASGSHHLYAPASPAICFWLEAQGYGRDAGPVQLTPLEGEERFWVIPDEVRGWFSPNPPAGAEARATGGTSVVLRQAPCAESPPATGR